MAFDPLPELLTARLRDLSTRTDPVVVDLGCGQGAFRDLLTPFGLRPWGVDRVPPSGGTAADLVSDARQPAVRTGTVDLLLAGNLLRHLVGRGDRWEVAARWSALLKPGGLLIILEDEPATGRPAENNYRRVQDFLARVSAGRRVPLLPLAEAEPRLRSDAPDLAWRTGRQKNTLRPDAEAVLAFLGGTGAAPTGEVADLIDAIREHGLSYGRFWWAAGERNGRDA